MMNENELCLFYFACWYWHGNRMYYCCCHSSVNNHPSLVLSENQTMKLGEITMRNFADRPVVKAICVVMNLLLALLTVAPTVQAAEQLNRANLERAAAISNTSGGRALNAGEMGRIVGAEDDVRSQESAVKNDAPKADDRVGKLDDAQKADQKTQEDAAVAKEPLVSDDPKSGDPQVFANPQKPSTQNQLNGVLGAFNVDQFTGSATMSVPIEVPTGRCGIQPNLALTYRSGGENSWCGVGWDLDPGYIIQLGAYKGVPRYTDGRFFLSLGGSMSELVVDGSSSIVNDSLVKGYRAKIEGSFLRFKAWFAGGALSPSRWEVFDNNATKYSYGTTIASRTDGLRPGIVPNPLVVFKWHLDRVTDVNGNYMTLSYYKEPVMADYQVYLDRIDYTYDAAGANNKCYVVFGREDRGDYAIKYNAGFTDRPLRMLRRLKTIEVYADSKPQRKYELNYGTSGCTQRSLLTSVTQCGSDGNSWSGNQPPITFTYKQPSVTHTYAGYMNGPTQVGGDFNGDGRIDLINGEKVYLSQSNGLSGEYNWGNGSYHGSIVTFGDFNGDGRSDVLYFMGPYSGAQGKLYAAYSSPTGFTYSDLGIVCGYDATNCIGNSGDINGDGKDDIVIVHKGGINNPIPWGKLGVSTGNSFTFSSLGIFNWTNKSMADANGDGLCDLVDFTSGGATRVWLSNGATITYSFGLSDGHLQSTGDFNGDGVSDLIQCAEYNAYVLLSKTNEFSPTYTWVSGNSDIYPDAPCPDVNGDGITDIVDYHGTDCYIWYSNGHGSSSMLLTASGHPDLVGGDFNGDGRADLVQFAAPYAYVWVTTGEAPDYLSSVCNGIGGAIDIAYQPISNCQNTYMPGGAQVVTSVTMKDGIPAGTDDGFHQYTTNYTFTGGRFDYIKKEPRGFNTCTVIKTVGTTTDSTKTWSRQDDIYQGRADSTKSWRSGSLLSKSVNTWAHMNLYSPATFAYISRVDNYIASGGVLVKRTAVDDAVYCHESGAVRNSRNLGEVDLTTGADLNAADNRITHTEVIHNDALHIYGKPKESCIKRGSDNAILRQQRFYYDGATSIETPPVKGLLTKTENWLDLPTETWVKTDFAYFSNGNIHTTTDALDRVTRIEYDDAGVFPISRVNAKNQTVSTQYYGVNYTDQTQGRYGQVRSQTDPNGACVTSTFDVFGRPLKTWDQNQNESWPGKQWDYRQACLGNPMAQSTVEYGIATSSYRTWSETFFDGMGRTMQVHKGTDGGPTQEVRTSVLHDGFGHPHYQSLPYYGEHGNGTGNYGYIPPVGVKWVRSQYDGLGRTVRVTQPDNVTYSTIAYDGFTTTKTDENGKQKQFINDAYGHLTQVIEYINGGTQTTTYEYDAMGNLVTIINARGQQSRFYYDSFGRKLRMEDPDRGTWEYAYDQAGSLNWQKDARNVQTSFTYDELNRILTKTNAVGTVTYTYDETAEGNKGIGRLTKVVDPSGTAQFLFNQKGQLTREVRALAGITVKDTIRRSYNMAGALDTLTYPDGEKVPYVYDEYGRLRKVATYAVNMDYSSAGQVQSYSYGNGINASFTYDANRLWLKQSEYQNPGVGMAYGLYLGYDKAGNVDTVDNLSMERRWLLEYDDLYRLTTETCVQTVPDYVTYYTNTFSYAGDEGKLGNRTSFNGQAYSYITGTNRLYDDGIRTFMYDNNGNVNSDGANTYLFNADNRLQKVTYDGGNTEYFYNSVGLRVKKVVTTGGLDPRELDVIIRSPGAAAAGAAGVVRASALMTKQAVVVTVPAACLDGNGQLYFGIDTDGIMGSGNLFLPDAARTGVEAASAWEYCLYLGGRDNAILYDQRLKTDAAQGRLAEGIRVDAAGDKARITIPMSLLGKPERVALVALATAGAGINDLSKVQSPKAEKLANNVIYGATILLVPPIGTVTTTYYIFDEAGHPLCELDKYGKITTKYYYLNGQLLARSNIVGTTVPSGTPLNDGLESTANFSFDPNQSYTTATLVTDRKQGSYAIQTVSQDNGDFANFSLVDQNIGWNTGSYRYVHLWVKPEAGAEWVTFHMLDVDHAGDPNPWRTMLNTTDGQAEFRVGKDLKAGVWNELWIDINRNDRGWGNGNVRSFHMHTNVTCTFKWDHFYTTNNSGYDFAYYHNDQLGSPRAMTNASGTVIWRQDYYAFGKDYDGTAQGNGYKYNGKPVEAVGLYYYGTRYYDPEVGRFISCDVVSKYDNPQSLNPYVYCVNNPQTYVDPNGDLFGIDDWIVASVAITLFNLAAAAYDSWKNGTPMTYNITVVGPTSSSSSRKDRRTTSDDSGMTGIGCNICDDDLVNAMLLDMGLNYTYGEPEYLAVNGWNYGIYMQADCYYWKTGSNNELGVWGYITYYQDGYAMQVEEFHSGPYTSEDRAKEGKIGGALPEGLYLIAKPTKTDRPGFKRKDELGVLGWKSKLTPLFKTTRTALYAHPDGRSLGTEGCPGFDGTGRAFHEILNEGGMYFNVQYHMPYGPYQWEYSN
ncbi:MAG: hypothetical protein EG824_06315 [Deltaproteobacteria bacterium]|nr:hypothetical protein [Deltaproteobacteria bacterium]